MEVVPNSHYIMKPYCMSLDRNQLFKICTYSILAGVSGPPLSTESTDSMLYQAQTLKAHLHGSCTKFTLYNEAILYESGS